MITMMKHSCNIDSTLKSRISHVAQTYCKDGTLAIGYVGAGQDNSRRFCSFWPDDKSLPALLICTMRDCVVDVGSLYPSGQGHPAFMQLKKEIIRQHNAGEMKYWD